MHVQDTLHMFGDTSNGVSWTNIATAGISQFPREWVQAPSVSLFISEGPGRKE